MEENNADRHSEAPKKTTQKEMIELGDLDGFYKHGDRRIRGTGISPGGKDQYGYKSDLVVLDAVRAVAEFSKEARDSSDLAMKESEKAVFGVLEAIVADRIAEAIGRTPSNGEIMILAEFEDSDTSPEQARAVVTVLAERSASCDKECPPSMKHLASAMRAVTRITRDHGLSFESGDPEGMLSTRRRSPSP